MYLKLYRFVTWFFGPLIELYLLKRKLSGKEDETRFYERKGKTNIKRPQGRLLWFHAASVGESVSVIPIINEIKLKYPSLNFLITTGTVTSSKILKGRLPKDVIHQYVPIDRQASVRRFLSHWRPDVAFFVESELWPNLIIETHKTGCTIIQLNARISAHSFSKWKKYPDIIEAMLACVSLSIAQSEVDKERIDKLGAKKSISLGNLKFEAPALPADPTETGKVLSMIGSRNIWLAASTHSGEEEIIAKAHKKIKLYVPDLLTIIVPRHSNRGEDIASTLKAKGLIITQRSKEKEILKPDTDIYLADTMGELGLFYRLAGIVFMGGSLIPHGGQNPLEAARLDCAILSGDNFQNFKKVYKEMIEEHAAIIVTNVDELAQTVIELINNGSEQRKIADNALEYINGKSGIIERYLVELEPYLKPLVY
jgi:3-deoxy-D-manno-octulosonic-acid transferase